ncbi:PepSY domain-containing protein [Rhodobacter ferrooxidans]|uniref:NADPH--hemoprotein reductase n=1 Tax=Rhodobacter ferrooxidans TaxID=371731 RepID=C8RZQ1_9RHOB|nr:PepSY domain-containing protein [Rhodobacter sp. SW2]EEW25848.1 oxidoreductase FAD/NAD(P)-binding domain protein [Rhodobacter sp. SW2]
MLRQLHSIPGLVLGLVLIVLSVSGAILSIDPAMERLDARPIAGISVAQMAERVVDFYPDIERIDRRANGVIVVTYTGPDGYHSDLIDPENGYELQPWTASPFMLWLKGLHRSFLLDDTGRAVAGVAAGGMALMALTGLLLLVAALGGWSRLTRPVRGAQTRRWHGTAGRLAVPMLALSALTGAMMSLYNFEYLPDGSADEPDFPFEVDGGPALPVGQLAALQAVPLDDLYRLTFPVAGDPLDVFGLQTNDGSGYVDQATGEALNWLPTTTAQAVSAWVVALHTGQGIWWLGLLLGLGALAIPVLSTTGTLIWLKRRGGRPKVAGLVRAGEADLVILVGSEGGSTWGFAATLATALIDAGRRVHLAAMNDLKPYPKAQALLVLAATYGDGEAPGSAKQFLTLLQRNTGPTMPVAVLGFGDRMFAQYCGYADTVAAALQADGWPQLLETARIDRQSVVDFAAWGRDLGKALNLPLVLDHRLAQPDTVELELISRQDFGEAVKAPAAILSFVAAGAAKLPRFEAGDLVGILPEGSDLPRYYSLASSRRDGMLQISVRKAPGGLCSGQLHALKPGGRIRAFIRPNPDFRPQPHKPVIMVAAGCGVGPMAGFLRGAKAGRGMELYYGARDPGSDYLYETELAGWQSDGRLSHLVTAFSRVEDKAYVQDRIRADADHLREQVARGAQILVCGGSPMAKAVATEVDAALAPLGLSVAGLKAEGRYLEDVY